MLPCKVTGPGQGAVQDKEASCRAQRAHILEVGLHAAQAQGRRPGDSLLCLPRHGGCALSQPAHGLGGAAELGR